MLPYDKQIFDTLSREPAISYPSLAFPYFSYLLRGNALCSLLFSLSSLLPLSSRLGEKNNLETRRGNNVTDPVNVTRHVSTSRTQILHGVPRNVALIKSPCYKFVPRLCGFTARANSGDKRQEFSSMPPIRRLNPPL